VQRVHQPIKIGALDGNIYVEVHADIDDTGLDYVEVATWLLEERGWSDLVDWERLHWALEEKRGVPTLISEGRPLLREPPLPEAAIVARAGS
jgi:hypothetical protein